MKEPAEAVAVLRDRVSAARTVLGDRHPTTAGLRSDLTRLLIDLGRDREAAEFETGTLVLSPGEGTPRDGR